VVSSVRRRRRGQVDHSVSRTEVPVEDTGDTGDTGNTGARPAPRQHQYNTRLEIVYTAIPLALVMVLLALALRTTSTLTATSAEPALQVDVKGFQWQWQFTYPQHRITITAGGPDSYPTLVLPVGRTVRFDLSADDVIHSFWVPEFLEKRDLIPGVDNVIEVFVKAPGEWTGRCAEYCGFNHWRMKFTVRAIPADEFDRWVIDHAAQPQPIVEGASR
jgi:cytochrome c oxidase subunit 2